MKFLVFPVSERTLQEALNDLLEKYGDKYEVFQVLNKPYKIILKRREA